MGGRAAFRHRRIPNGSHQVPGLQALALLHGEIRVQVTVNADTAVPVIQLHHHPQGVVRVDPVHPAAPYRVYSGTLGRGDVDAAMGHPLAQGFGIYQLIHGKGPLQRALYRGAGLFLFRLGRRGSRWRRGFLRRRRGRAGTGRSRGGRRLGLLQPLVLGEGYLGRGRGGGGRLLLGGGIGQPQPASRRRQAGQGGYIQALFPQKAPGRFLPIGECIFV